MTDHTSSVDATRPKFSSYYGTPERWPRRKHRRSHRTPGRAADEADLLDRRPVDGALQSSPTAGPKFRRGMRGLLDRLEEFSGKASPSMPDASDGQAGADQPDVFAGRRCLLQLLTGLLRGVVEGPLDLPAQGAYHR